MRYARASDANQTAVTVEIPMRLPSVSNLREHWAARSKRTKMQRDAVRVVLISKAVGTYLDTHLGQLVVSLTRCSTRQLDSHDNLRSAFKACADAVAAYFGLDDADPRIRFEYSQEKAKLPCVRISFRIEAT